MNWTRLLLICGFLISAISLTDALPMTNRTQNLTTEAFEPDLYKNYLICLARCGKHHTTRVNQTLLSGEIVTDLVRNDTYFGVVSFNFKT